jgi:hypothetical protein
MFHQNEGVVDERQPGGWGAHPTLRGKRLEYGKRVYEALDAFI